MLRSGHVGFLLVMLCVDICFTAAVPRSFDPHLNEEMYLTPKKRPFCNAFTGCGRKRSQGFGAPTQELMRQRQYVDESLLGVPPDSSENTIDELSRQILSEAKLWEAIQEAAADIARRRQKQYAYN